MSLLRRGITRQTGQANPKKNAFDLSNYMTMSHQLGHIIPIRWDDVTPDSHWEIKTNVITKMAELLTPILHRVDVLVHTHWVPYRLCMPKVSTTNTDWETFIQGDPNNDFTNDVMPTIELTDALKAYWYKQGLFDYMGMPTVDATHTIHANGEVTFNALPIIAYHLIYDEHYRNPWIEARRCGPGATWTVDLSGGDRTADIASLADLQYASYDNNLITGAYPEAYQGASTDVEMNLDWSIPTAASYRTSGGAMPGAGNTQFTAAQGVLKDAAGTAVYHYDNAVFEMMDFRRLQALTRFLEAENRTGTDRYDEWLKVMFGVQNPDFRDQYPRFIGGFKQTVNVSEIIANNETLEGNTNDLSDMIIRTPQGHQTGHAVAAGSGKTFKFHATEHGCLMTVLIVKPKFGLTNNIERFWHKTDRTEFFNPKFEHIGDQEIYEAEVAYDCEVSGTQLDTWAYQERFYEYKDKLDVYAGEFKTNGLDAWHMAYIHDPSDDVPAFTYSFNKISFSADRNLRCFNTGGTVDHFYTQVYNDIRAVLPITKVDIPY